MAYWDATNQTLLVLTNGKSEAILFQRKYFHDYKKIKNYHLSYGLTISAFIQEQTIILPLDNSGAKYVPTNPHEEKTIPGCN